MKLIYKGPPGQAIAGVPGELVPGAEIDLPADVAKSLADHAWFEKPADTKPAKEAEA